MAKPGKPMKRRPSPERSCLGKQYFDTFAKALAASRIPPQRRGRTDRPNKGRLEPYKCHFCDGYHFGHPVRRKLSK